ncbi:TasA family protein [Clostridium sp. D33t1_170424_F3]|uniref:TasA family protein n=1 Tax=Clostridium sp. D33t1_170424_F3 TaxID=2787099 RepID=UPI0018AA92B1|nr:TasA family protein [Clostridium sp. D33t1_170424_F3]
MKTKKSRILLSAVSVLLVFSLLVGGTMAWFTDTEKVDANFTAGILDIEVNPDPDYTTKKPLEFENLRPMQYQNFYKELEPEIAFGNELDNNVAANGMQDSDYKPVPVYFKPVQIENRGTLPTKVDISVNLGEKCAEGEENIELTNNDNTVDWDGAKNGNCTNGLQKVLKIFVYKNVDGVWERIDGVNLNKLYDESVADPDKAAADNTKLETENMYTTAMIPAGKDATYVIAGYLPETVGNEYQGKHYHADLMFNAYQMDEGAGGGTPDEGGSTKPEAKDVQIVIHYTLADGTKIGEDYSITAKSNAFPYTVTETLAAPGLPQGYHFADPEQSYQSELTGEDTASDVTFIVEADPPVEVDVQVKINYIDREVDPSKTLKTHTETISIAEGGSYTLTDTNDVVKNNLPTAPAGYTYVFDETPQTQTVTYPDDFSAEPNVANYRFAEMKFYVRLELQEPENPDNCPYPHIIHNENELKQVANHMSHNFVVANDFSINKNTLWRPLGFTDSDADIKFTGVFDGNNKVISDMTCLPSNVGDVFGIGLFSNNGGTIKDLTLKDANIKGAGIIGVVAGQNTGTIENCHVNGLVTGALYGTTTMGTGTFAGGITGASSGVIRNCSSDVSLVGYSAVGGIVGYNTNGGIVDQCWAKGSINKGYKGNVQQNMIQIGGLVGANTSSAVIRNSWCAPTGYIVGRQYVGGFTGYQANTGSIISCYVVHNGNVNSVADGSISVGYNLGSTSSSYAESDTSGSANGFTRTSKANLQSGNALNGFDTSVWNFSSGSYPDLISNPRA